MRVLWIIVFYVSISTVQSVQAADEKPLFKEWVFPNATAKQKSVTNYSVKSPGQPEAVHITIKSGQYLTEKPFHEVLAFYVRKSGFTPPNWTILGRKLSDTKVHIPASWSQKQKVDGKIQKLTILHYIRENTASAHFLITNHPEMGDITIAIASSKNDPKTLIQVIQNPTGTAE